MDLSLVLGILAAGGILLVFLGVNSLLAQPIDLVSRLGAYAGMAEVRQAAEAVAVARPHAARRPRPGRDFGSSLAQDLAQANLRLTVTEYLLLHAVSASLLMVVGYLASHNLGGGIVLGMGGLYLPRLWVKSRQRARRRAFDAQLGDTMTLAANSLRSGYSLLQALEVVSRDAPQPSAEEFGRVVREVSLGLTPEQALANLIRRVQSEDLELMVTAINVQHQVGGNLSMILDTISGTIRERVRVKGEIQSLTSQQRLSGYIIALLPVALAVFLTLVSPAYMLQLFSLQRVICMPMICLPIGGVIMIGLGFFFIQKIVAIEV